MTAPVASRLRPFRGRQPAIRWRGLTLVLVGIAMTVRPSEVSAAPAPAPVPPASAVADREGEVEVRAYPARWVVETRVSGERGEATQRGLLLLRDYLAGKDRRGHTVPLPFRQPLTRIETPLGWTLQLDLPGNALAGDLREPADPRVSLRRLPAQSFIVLPIQGTAEFAAVNRQSRLGQAFAATHGLTVEGPPSVAFYSAPGLVWFLQKAEFRIPVALPAHLIGPRGPG